MIKDVIRCANYYIDLNSNWIYERREDVIRNIIIEFVKYVIRLFRYGEFLTKKDTKLNKKNSLTTEKYMPQNLYNISSL